MRRNLGVSIGSCVLAIVVSACVAATGRTGFTGIWRVEGVGAEFPWYLDLRVDGREVTGTVTSCASRRALIGIYDVLAEGDEITFKCISLDSDRVLTFTGRLDGDELALAWEKQVREGALRDGRDPALFGDSAPAHLIAKRVLNDRSIDELLGVGGAAIDSSITPSAQQIADTTFHPPIDSPAYAQGTGPIVVLDEAHGTFHTLAGRYRPFAELLRRDGYVVSSSSDGLTVQSLQGAKVLVTANAQRSFDSSEIAAVREWVWGGGSLLLIVDHPPFVVASVELAAALGVRLRNAGAADPGASSGRLVFRRSDETLIADAITGGIDSVATFTGSSFELDAVGRPLLVFGPGIYSDDSDPVPLEGSLQGAVLEFGMGRVAVFGEAAMFSAQVITGPMPSPMGMNAPIAGQNAQFLLNLMHWLASRE